MLPKAKVGVPNLTCISGFENRKPGPKLLAALTAARVKLLAEGPD